MTIMRRMAHRGPGAVIGQPGLDRPPDLQRCRNIAPQHLASPSGPGRLTRLGVFDAQRRRAEYIRSAAFCISSVGL